MFTWRNPAYSILLVFLNFKLSLALRLSMEQDLSLLALPTLKKRDVMYLKSFLYRTT